MAKIARLFTVDYDAYQIAKATIPNMSEVVNNALVDAVTQMKGDKKKNPFKGISRRILNKAADKIAESPSGVNNSSQFWAGVFQNKHNVKVDPADLAAYVQATKLL